MNTSPLMQLTLPGNALVASVLGAKARGPFQPHHVPTGTLVGDVQRSSNGARHGYQDPSEQFERRFNQQHHHLSIFRGEQSPSHDG